MLTVNEGISYAQAAEKLGVSVPEVRNAIHAARTRLASFVRAEIMEYCSNHEELRDELAALSRRLP